MMNKSKTKIVIASILKPIDDVRNYEKIASSLDDNENIDVIIYGSTSSCHSNISIRSRVWSSFNRLSFKRLYAQREYWKALNNDKPDLVIFTTFELILVSVLYKVIYGCRLIYDVQEDYFTNLWYQKFYPSGIKHLAAICIRLLEICFSPFISKYFLAEKTYNQDIRHVRKKSIILENKSLPIERAHSQSGFNILFSGTISDYSKAIESIELFRLIKKERPESTMMVIGHVPSPNYMKKIKEQYHKQDGLVLNLSTKPIPHQDIIHAIKRSDLAIIGYQPNPVNRNKMPTKLYEYTAARLPYIVQKNTIWSTVGSQLGGAIPVDFEHPDIKSLLILRNNVSNMEYAKDGYLWSEEESKLECILKYIN